MKTNEKTRIFIVGCARSGTTLIQSMLASHPYLTSFTESHLYTQAFLSKPRLFFPPYNLMRPRLPISVPFLNNAEGDLFQRDFRKRFEEFQKENGLDEDKIILDLPSYICWLPFHYLKLSEEFIRVFDHIAEKRDALGWIEKTPHNLYYIPLIRYTSNSVKFVHIVREGRENVASLYRTSRQHWTPKPLNACVKEWNRAIKATKYWMKKPNNFIVLYEQLVEYPEKILKEVSRKLSLEWAPKMLQYQDSVEQIVNDGEGWKNRVKESLQLIEKYNDTFDKGQRNYIERNLDLQKYFALKNSLK